MRLLATSTGLLAILLMSTVSAQQAGDAHWRPTVEAPEFPNGAGPRILIDGGHHNFHTLEGRFAGFARLARADGYVVDGHDGVIDRTKLDECDILVISNAGMENPADPDWRLPTPLAFTADEVAVIVEWVNDGGSLLLIADHMPAPGAVENLAAAFGLEFINGFALPQSPGPGSFGFNRDNGGLADHAITTGRAESEHVSQVTSFTGQGFRAVVPVDWLLKLPEGWRILLPSEAWEFGPDTPSMSARGLLQGAVLAHGNGRVAAFGEAAMFTSQTARRGDTVVHFGLSSPEAPENAQFVLNVLHWLTGRLGD